MITVGTIEPIPAPAPLKFNNDSARTALREFMLDQFAAAGVSLDDFLETVVWTKGYRNDQCMAVFDHNQLSILRNILYGHDEAPVVNMSTFGELMIYDRSEDVYQLGFGKMVRCGEVSKTGSIRFVVGIRILLDNQPPIVFHDLMSMSHLSCGYLPQE